MRLSDISIKGLRRRLGRMLLLLVSLATAVTTVVTLVSVSRSMNSSVAHDMDQFGANIVIVPQASDLALVYGGISVGTAAFDVGTLTLTDLEAIKTIPSAHNVAVVAPKLLTAVDVAEDQVLMAGVIFPDELRLRRWWQVQGAYPAGLDAASRAPQPTHGKPETGVAGDAAGANQALLGYRLAEALGLEAGDTLDVQGRTLEITGVLEENGSKDDQMLFVDLALAQEIAGAPDEVNLVEIAALCHECPVEEIVRQIGVVLPQARVTAVRQAVALRAQTVGQLTRFTVAVSIVVALIGGLFVLTTMLGAVAERRQEIGLFRALGFRRSHIERVILGEAAFISLVGGALGWLAGMGVVALLRPTIAELAMGSPWDPVLALGALAGTLLVGLGGAMYPALRAANLDPTTALRAL